MTIHESFFKNWLKLTFYWLLHQPEIQRQESQLGRSEKCNESISWLSSVFTFSATFTATFIRLWRFTSSFCCFFLNSSFPWVLFLCLVPLFITRIASGITTRSCFGHSFYKLLMLVSSEFYSETKTNRLTLFHSLCARFFTHVTLIDISKLIVMLCFAYKYLSSAISLLFFIWVCFTGITKQLPSFYFIWETLLESMSINLAFSQIAPHGYLSLIKMCSLALTLKLLYFRWFSAQIQFSWSSFRLYRNCGFRWLKRGLLDRMLCLNTFLYQIWYHYPPSCTNNKQCWSLK